MGRCLRCRAMLVALPLGRCASAASLAHGRSRVARFAHIEEALKCLVYKQCHNKSLKEEEQQSQKQEHRSHARPPGTWLIKSELMCMPRWRVGQSASIIKAETWVGRPLSPSCKANKSGMASCSYASPKRRDFGANVRGAPPGSTQRANNLAPLMGVRECAVGIASQLCRARQTALVYPSSKLLAERNSTISPLALPLPLCVMDAIVALRTRRSAPSSTRQTTSKLRSWIKQRSSASPPPPPPPPPPSGSSPQSQKESRNNDAELDINSHETVPYQPKTALFRALNSVHPKWLIGACFLAWVAVFTAWYSAKVSAQNRDYRWILSMDENFVMAKINLEEGRWWTLLTSSFSHSDLS